MPAALPLKDPVKVGQLLRRRLRELKRTPRDCDEFLRPRITTWDIDLDTHAMRIVLR